MHAKNNLLIREVGSGGLSSLWMDGRTEENAITSFYVNAAKSHM